MTLHNFGNLLHNNVKDNTGAQGRRSLPQLVPQLDDHRRRDGASSTTVLGALAAYAFSRFRFRGPTDGMLALLLIQMFPQFVAIAAIYLIVLNVGEVFPQIGLEHAGSRW